MVTTDDWEFEILAPRTWIDRRIQSLDLSPAGAPPSPSDLESATTTIATAPWRAIYQRKLHPIRDWYAPKPLDAYEAYDLGTTDVPYVHMLVESVAAVNGRRRVFISKH